MTQEFCRFVRFEIADRRSREKAHARQRGNKRRQLKCLREIRDERINQQMREVAAELRSVPLQKITGNIDRDIGLNGSRSTEKNARLSA